MILEGVVAYCETFNSDGINVGKENSTVLKSLGAEVVDGFSDTITHMVWSNGEIRKITAASLFNISVVSPSWLLRCEQSGARAPEAEFAVPHWPYSARPISSQSSDQERNSQRVSWPQYISSKGALNIIGDKSEKMKKLIVAQHLSEISPQRFEYFQKESPVQSLETIENGHIPLIMDRRMQIILSDVEEWPLTLNIWNQGKGTSVIHARLLITVILIISVLFTVVIAMGITFFVILYKL